MPFQIQIDESSKPDFCHGVVDGELSIYSVGELKLALTDAMNDYENFELDLSGIENTDSSGIQLLYAFKKTLSERGHTLRLRHITSDTLGLIRTYGLCETLGVDEPK